jgi:hypothetical protein
MGMLPREQLRQLIKENDIKDVNGIYDTLKDMLQDVLQEIVFCNLKFLTFAKLFPQAPVGNFYVNPSSSDCLIPMRSAQILVSCCFGREIAAGGSDGVFYQ